MSRKRKQRIALKYVGKGASLAGVPARDMTEAEAVNYAIVFFTSSGLYKLAKRKPAPPMPAQELEEELTDGRS